MAELSIPMVVNAADDSSGQSIAAPIDTSHVEIGTTEQQDAVQVQTDPAAPWVTVEQGLTRRFAGNAKTFRIRKAYSRFQSRAAVQAMVRLIPMENVVQTVIQSDAPGPAGTDGKSLLSGSAPPTSDIGNPGDTYINASNGDVLKKG